MGEIFRISGITGKDGKAGKTRTTVKVRVANKIRIKGKTGPADEIGLTFKAEIMNKAGIKEKAEITDRTEIKEKEEITDRTEIKEKEEITDRTGIKEKAEITDRSGIINKTGIADKAKIIDNTGTVNKAAGRSWIKGKKLTGTVIFSVLRQTLAILMVTILSLQPFSGYSAFLQSSLKAEAAEKSWYIKNNYTQGAYLYEEDGVLHYGIPTDKDDSFLWFLKEKNGYKILENKLTGHSISLKGHRDAKEEGSFGDPVACIPYEEGDDTFLWNADSGNGINIISVSSRYKDFALHIEGADNGQVRGQLLENDQLLWGNMKWDIIDSDSAKVSDFINDGFCIKNKAEGTFLRADDSKLTVGKPSGADDAYIWMIEEKEDGRKAIKNKKTGEYLSIEGYQKEKGEVSLSKTLSDKTAVWNFKLSAASFLVPGDKAFRDYGLILGDKEKVTLDNIKKSADYPSDNMKWSFLPSSEVGEVSGDLILTEGIYNLKNSWYSMYLMEDDGKAVYGNANPSDSAAQWQVIYDKTSGKTALKNTGTGDYLSAGTESGELVCNRKESYYWKLLRSKNADYPDAVIFQDSVNPDRYLHMENLTGYAEDTNAVQPTWGTPHWEPIPVEASGQTEAEKAGKAPEGYVRLQSAAKEGEYLYENSNGAICYGTCEEGDASSHWEFTQGNEAGVYYLKNRKTGHVVMNQGNGMLKGKEESEVKTDGAYWRLMEQPDGKMAIINAYSDLKNYLQPYLNIQKDKGYAESSLVSKEAVTSLWLMENAPENTNTSESEKKEEVPMKTFADTNLYRIFDGKDYIAGTYIIEYTGRKAQIKNNDTGKYLSCKNGIYTEKKKENSTSFDYAATESLGRYLLTNGDNTLQAEKLESDSQYRAVDAYQSKDSLVFAVFAAEDGNYTMKASAENKKITLTINGISASKVTAKKFEAALKKGINSVSFPLEEGIESLTVSNSINKNYRGASSTFLSYQAEDAVYSRSLLEDSRVYHEIASEASGRKAVKLSGTGENIKITLQEPANALVIRYSLPDTIDGSEKTETLNLYADGQEIQSAELTTAYSLVYGSYPWTNNPQDGEGHHFFDEVRIELGKTYPQGTVIKLQKDAANMADYYIIDRVETTLVTEPGTVPDNALSVTDFGAIADDGTDDTKAFSDCIKEAVKSGKEVFIPAGVFQIDTPTRDFDAGDNSDKNRGFVITDDNLVIRGAGMWQTVLKGEYAAFFIKASNVSLYDFTLSGTAVSRRDAIDPSAIETDYNTPSMKNLTIQNLWIEHYKTGIWTHNVDGLSIRGCRIANTFADGINLRRGTKNAVIEQCTLRNTGDDGIALWSSEYSDENIKIRYNTVELPWLANNISVYGGKDIEITDNILSDTVAMGAGINISTNFNPEPFTGTVTIERNTLNRCGSHDLNYNEDDGAIWFNTVRGNDNSAEVLVNDNLILDSSYSGVSFLNSGTLKKAVFTGNTIDGCGTYGIDVIKGAKGQADFINTNITNALLDKTNNKSEPDFKITSELQKITSEAKETKQSNDKKSGKAANIVIAGILIAAALAAAVVLLLVLTRRKKAGRN